MKYFLRRYDFTDTPESPAEGSPSRYVIYKKLDCHVIIYYSAGDVRLSW